MRTARRFIWGVLTTLAVASYGLAAQLSWYEYIGRYLQPNQGRWVDSNRDGRAEGLGYDVNRDGWYDAYRFSTFADGYLNAVVIDTSGNASFASAIFFLDTTRTGKFNVSFSVSGGQAYVSLDPDEDGHYTQWMSLNAPARPTEMVVVVGGGQATKTPPNMIYHEMVTGIVGTWLRPACEGSSYGCGRR